MSLFLSLSLDIMPMFGVLINSLTTINKCKFVFPAFINIFLKKIP